MKADVVVRSPSAECLNAILQLDALGEVIAIESAPSRELILLREGTRNHGILLRQRDVLLVPGNATPRRELLPELLQALHSSDRIAGVEGEGCLLLSHVALNIIGAFDARLDEDAQLADWEIRAAQFGLTLIRARR